MRVCLRAAGRDGERRGKKGEERIGVEEEGMMIERDSSLTLDWKLAVMLGRQTDAPRLVKTSADLILHIPPPPLREMGSIPKYMS